jgi:hypothetical protein
MRIAETVFRTGAEDAEDVFAECPHKIPSHMVTWARKTGLIPKKKRDPEPARRAREQVRVAVESGQPVDRAPARLQLFIARMLRD